MPQSSDELRKIVGWIVQPKLYLEVPDDSIVVKFLEERGYILNKDWSWNLPKQGHYISEMEMLCLRYLVEEWDYGVIKE